MATTVFFYSNITSADNKGIKRCTKEDGILIVIRILIFCLCATLVCLHLFSLSPSPLCHSVTQHIFFHLSHFFFFFLVKIHKSFLFFQPG